MEFIKKNIKLIIGIIIGMLIVSGISVYATYTYFATEISYTRNGTEISVAQALNELYSNNQETTELLTYDINIETCVGSYTYTSTKKQKLMITMYSAKGKSGTRGYEFYCRKNGIDLTVTNEKAPSEWVIMRCYIVDVEEGDVITLGTNSSGSYGDAGYSIFSVQ